MSKHESIDEKVAYWTGRLCIAIGEGRFKETLCNLILHTHKQSFQEGLDTGREKYAAQQETEEAKDMQDVCAAAHRFLSMTRCVGGRMVATGYICPHCLSFQPTGNHGYCIDKGVCGANAVIKELPHLGRGRTWARLKFRSQLY